MNVYAVFYLSGNERRPAEKNGFYLFRTKRDAVNKFRRIVKGKNNRWPTPKDPNAEMYLWVGQHPGVRNLPTEIPHPQFRAYVGPNGGIRVDPLQPNREDQSNVR